MKRSEIKLLAELRNGAVLPLSRFPSELSDALIAEGGVSRIVRGSRQSLKVSSFRTFDIFLLSKGLHPDKLMETLQVMDDRTSRAQLTSLTGDSKAVPVRSCPGFPVNVIDPLSVRLGERIILLCNCMGTFLFINDFWNFKIPSDVTVVGVENMENFRKVECHGVLFDQLESRLIFVSRYPQSKDLGLWLQSISNPYVHFGDFDLAEIHIYLTEFYARLGDRAEFFIPDDIEARLMHGSRERYDTQFERFGKMEITDNRVKPLVDLIHKYQRGYDQEGYIL